MPQLNPDHSAALVPAYDPADGATLAKPVSLADAGSAGTAAAPPHLLWQTLESAYALPEEQPPEPGEPRLAGYLALPIVLGLSLVLWVVVVALIAMR